MKNILFILILSGISINFYGQNAGFSYKYLNEFNGDTTAYVMYNYMERGEHHQNKTVGEFINEFELNIKSFLLSLDTNKPDNIIGVVFFPYEVNEVGRRNHHQMETNGIRLYFTEPQNAKSLLKKADKSGKNSWNKKMFNELKNNKIKLTRCLIYHYSPYKEIFKDKLDF